MGDDDSFKPTAIELISQPMQETLATPPFFDPPIDKFENLYSQWANGSFGIVITGQVQIDIRYLSIKGDVVAHKDSLKEPHFSKWKQWATISQQAGTPCIVQLAHPGRMSPAGAGERPPDMAAICPSSVPVELGEGWLNKKALNAVLGTPREATLDDIDAVVAAWVNGAQLAKEAGFAGCQLHGAHGFLLSQFLSPHTNRRTDDYGGSPEKRLALLKRLVKEIRDVCPRPYCLSVKLNSADYMATGVGLSTDEGLEQVKWLVECGEVDFVEISGGQAEQKTSKLHNSFGTKSLEQAPKRESTRIREAYFTDFAERVQGLNSNVPIQLSGGFRSRTGMADAIDSGICSLIGLGRSVVLQPDLPASVLLNPSVSDDEALAVPHIVKGQWLTKIIPVKVVGSGLAIQFFYHNMRRMGHGLKSDPDASIPYIVFSGILETFRSGLFQTVERLLQSFPWQSKASKID
ncbi:MAG: hypothetical protein ALECFALPRED_003037 [Alectoria fallacina]|uniref:NADH:flavin oxidoreductase/NADH oxidase N-terminal domain-containing protein n=1 Tax=Alectoria fallacina TaxID=1903189 RepID=A0A8H3EI35_9LECA|nr:MAG: hypothetical protein ALECFALPRED_003037 [Alectoria fallacina]